MKLAEVRISFPGHFKEDPTIKIQKILNVSSLEKSVIYRYEYTRKYFVMLSHFRKIIHTDHKTHGRSK